MSKGKVIVGGAGLAAVLALAAPLIQRYEGLKYDAYLDPVGIPTACWGHTGPDVKMGQRYTRAQCEAWLEQDMHEANAIVRRCIPGDMPQGVESALTSAAFNIGPKVVCGSTLQGYALASNWQAACAELSKWKYSKGRVFKGLVLRRADERRMCESGL
ncbi:lysozyme [Lysobacter panacisoli]|uniref:Lysozyme n=1 Tax=Lysobacter panacisoli TaxID=1255263 RepID=A0ABP9LDG0_9GAMM|nr:lysozyme [Lysobacter panacisoli]